MSTPVTAYSKGAVIVVDPYSTGCCLAQEFSKNGYQIVALWTKGFSEEMKTHIPLSCANLNYFAEVNQQDTNDQTKIAVLEAIGSLELSVCLAGGEAGVDFADEFSEFLGLRTNGTDIPNRRDKKLQQELIKELGMRSVRQAGGDKFEDVEGFLRTEQYPVVVKPVESAGSDGVKLCANYEEAKEHFLLLMRSQMVNGGLCPAVLCQEFLRGKEYVVDHVSRDGVHKTTMVWVYDKRPVNGSAFVYFGCLPIESDSEEANLVIPYIRGVLDALGVKNGPTHGEVMMTPDGPCLVEMNCRAKGADGTWIPLARALTGGYSQIDGTVAAYLDEDNFNRIPDRPPSPFKASGLEADLVSFSSGIVESAPGFDVIRSLPSFLYLETGVKIGSKVNYTVDLLTTPGAVMLMHKDEKVLQRDLDFLRYLEEINGLFVYKTRKETLKKPESDAVLELVDQLSEIKKPIHRRVFSQDGPNLIRHMSNDRPELRGPLVRRMTTMDATKEVVVVVNPYSTGCWIVKEILERAYSVIAVYTKGFGDSDMVTHIPLRCTGLNYMAVVVEGSNLGETAKAVRKAAGNLRLVGCLAGGESGVGLADELSERLAVRTNGTGIPDRRNKKRQVELIRDAGMRAPRQAGGNKFEDVEEFLKTESYPVVLKPYESAGSDGVKLCHNFEEAKEHFHIVIESSSRDSGEECYGVLCQEFLRGKEYVVDHVSRDGVHKTMMVWEYDKRPANGAAFVYFGCIPVDPQSPEAKLLIPYARATLDAIDLKNGPSHGEFMMTPNGPCLVEMNCRAHGGDGNWKPLCTALTGGYCQVDAAVDSYFDKASFDRLPDTNPSPFKAAGQEVLMVSYTGGIVKATPGFDEIKQMESYVFLETGVHTGSKIVNTVDLYSCLGSAMLMHNDPDVLERDVNRIRQLENENALFEFEESAGSGIMKSPSRLTLSDVTAYVSDRSDVYN